MRVRLTFLSCCSALVLALAASPAGAASPAPASNLKAHYLALPMSQAPSHLALEAQGAAATTVINWSHPLKSPVDGQSYRYTMVGRNPFRDWGSLGKSSASTVAVDIVPVDMVIGTTSFDPTTATPGCSAKTPLKLTTSSPLFQTHDYVVDGTDVGSYEYTASFQREEFASQVLASGALNPDYTVNLVRKVQPLVTVNVPSADGVVGNYGGSCPLLGQVDISWWDSYVRTTLMPALYASGETAVNRLPLFVLDNVVAYSGSPSNCCILGYHSAMGATGGTQTYSVADYDTTNLFTSTQDVGPMSHELAEWMNDPFVNNATPSWGHIGQVGGCQNNLEVGDPLSGTNAPAVTMANGVTYHPQELAFDSWFYRTRSTGIGGWFSNNGTFTSDAGGLCS